MSDHPSAPFLSEEHTDDDRPPRPSSPKSKTPDHPKYHPDTEVSEESAPLLPSYSENRNDDDSDSESDLGSHHTSRAPSVPDDVFKKHRIRWPAIIAIILLCLIIIAILGIGFAIPAAVEEYAKEAVTFEPTDLSIDSFTSSGVRARVRGDFSLDAAKVRKKPTRDLGRFGTWIVKAIETKPTTVKVYVPEYDNILLGVADVPAIVVDVRNGHTTHIDILSDLRTGDTHGIRHLATQWLMGGLGQLRVRGTAEIALKSGIFGLGKQTVSKSYVFEGEKLNHDSSRLATHWLRSCFFD